MVSLLVKQGTLNQGDLVLAGEYYGRVRAMTDENGEKSLSGTLIPVEILGLPDTPGLLVASLWWFQMRNAREVAEYRADRERERFERRSNHA